MKEWECRCGVANRVQKIVGGEGVESNEYPWQVGITSPGSTRPWCGGSILTTTSILTAAHCTRGTGVEDMIVIVGEHDWSQEDGQEREGMQPSTSKYQLQYALLGYSPLLHILLDML